MSEQSKQMRELALDSPSKSLAKVLLEFADYMESTDSRRKSLESTIEQQQARIAELESYNVRLAIESHEKSLKIDELSATVESLRGLFGDFENDPNDSRIGWNKKTLEVLRATPPQNLNAVKREVAESAVKTALRNLGEGSLSEQDISSFAKLYANTNYPSDKE